MLSDAGGGGGGGGDDDDEEEDWTITNNGGLFEVEEARDPTEFAAPVPALALAPVAVLEEEEDVEEEIAITRTTKDRIILDHVVTLNGKAVWHILLFLLVLHTSSNVKA